MWRQLLLLLLTTVGLPLAIAAAPCGGPFAEHSCLNAQDGKLFTYKNGSIRVDRQPGVAAAACCALCAAWSGAEACGAWTLWGAYSTDPSLANRYCTLYRSDNATRYSCDGSISSLPTHAGPPPPPPAPPVPRPPAPRPGAKQLDVLMIMVDDLRYQFGVEGPGVLGPGCSGAGGGASASASFPGCTRMVTPAIDALARRNGSTLFARNYCQQAVCTASRASVLTGRRPDASDWGGEYWRTAATAGNWSTLPEAFRRSGEKKRAAHFWFSLCLARVCLGKIISNFSFEMHVLFPQGYRTIGIGKLFHGGGHSGDPTKGLGVDDVGVGPGTYSWSEPYWHAPDMGHYPYSGVSWRAVPLEEEQQFPLADTQLADRTIHTLQSLSTERQQQQQQQSSRYKTQQRQPQRHNVQITAERFFVGVGFHRPHLPFIFPAAKLDLFPPESISLPAHQYPPKGMPPVAWSNFYMMETKGYSDIAQIAEAGAKDPRGEKKNNNFVFCVLFFFFFFFFCCFHFLWCLSRACLGKGQ
jgi:hypothetical protein